MQSIQRYPTFDTWLTEFLFVMFERAFKHLLPGGYLVISISYVAKLPTYTAALIEHLNGLEGCRYVGCMAYTQYTDRHNSRSDPVNHSGFGLSKRCVVFVKNMKGYAPLNRQENVKCVSYTCQWN